MVLRRGVVREDKTMTQTFEVIKRDGIAESTARHGSPVLSRAKG
jgi:hypothetical protein